MSGDIPFTDRNGKQPPGEAGEPASVHRASGPSSRASDIRKPRRGLRVLLGEPEVRLMMRADRVDERHLLKSLDAVAAWLRKEARKARRQSDDHPSHEPPMREGRRYRRGVGVVLLNRPGEVFVGRRVDVPEEAWQPPQGGIDPGEAPRAAALRELREEIGTDNVEVIAESKGWITYDVPEELSQKAWGGRWQGQRQKWFVMLHLGRDDEIDIATDHPEFSAWRWVPLHQLPSLAVAFKRRLYARLTREFERVVSEQRRS
jgi:putative (di)nucleoside polyphosphate hydrolase